MSRRVVFRILALLLALVLALTLSEVALRLAPGGGYRPTAAGERWAFVRPGEIRPRTPPVVVPKLSEAFRLVTVGDSYTWGDGVYPEDTYAARLARRLAATWPEREVDLVNLSRPGWNTFQQQWWFRRLFDDLAPDLVVLGFCLNDAEPFDQEALTGLRQVLGEMAEGPPPPPPPARGPSVVLNRLAMSWRNLESRRRVRAYYRSLYDDQPGWEAAQRALAGLARASREKSFPLLMVVFPIFDSQLDHRYPYRDLHAEARRAGEEAGLPVLDLLPFYEGIDARRLAVVPFTDPHPNELAPRIAADAIAEELIERGWGPASR